MPETNAASRAPMRIGVIGAGAMGSSLAAIASRVAPTVMVVRNPQRAAQIFDRGIAIHGQIEASARPIIVRSVADLPEVGGVDYLFVATKTTAIPALCADLKPVLPALAAHDRQVRVVSYQNGIEPATQMIELLDTALVLRMVLHYGGVLDPETGVVDVHMHEPPHYVGCLDTALAPDCEMLASLLTMAEFPTNYEPNIETRVWAKAILNAAMSPVAALVNATIGDVLDSPGKLVVDRLLSEGVEAARLEGIDLGDDFLPRAMEVLERGRRHIPSMVEDIRRGRESEVGQLNHQIVAHAHRLGGSAPTHEAIVALIETFDWRIYHGVRAEQARVGGAHGNIGESVAGNG